MADLSWQKDHPSHSGWYWLWAGRCGPQCDCGGVACGFHEPCIVRVEKSREEHEAYYGLFRAYHAPGGTMIWDRSTPPTRALWAGPIDPPPRYADHIWSMLWRQP